MDTKSGKWYQKWIQVQQTTSKEFELNTVLNIKLLKEVVHHIDLSY